MDDKERTAFELWAKPLFFSLLRCLHDTEQYDSLTTEAAWMAWQARASHPEYRSSGERGEAALAPAPVADSFDGITGRPHSSGVLADEAPSIGDAMKGRAIQVWARDGRESAERWHTYENATAALSDMVNVPGRTYRIVPPDGVASVAPVKHWCETCEGLGTIDETLGGESFSNPKAPCPDCDGQGWWTPRAALGVLGKENGNG